MLLGYNTNGLAHHDLGDAIELLAEIGYESVAITVDHGSLNPLLDASIGHARQLRQRLKDLGMRSVVETGARFLLDARVKHEPTLMSPDPRDRSRRVDFLYRCIDLAKELESDCVSLWSGILREPLDDEPALERLTGGLRKVLERAADRDCTIGFEPEPGMFVDTTAAFERLLQWVDGPHLRMTLDVGHLYCQGEVPIADYIARWMPRVVNVHIEDMRAGVHEHLMFGEGEMHFPPILRAFAENGYAGALHVELSRHSHVGPTAARQAYEFLAPLLEQLSRERGTAG